MSRRPGRTSLALLLPALAFIAFGAARVVAPVGLLGLVFHQPAGFAVAAAVTSLLGAVLLLIRPVEMAVARVIAGPAREPTEAERGDLEPALERLGGRSGIDTGKLIVRVQEGPEINASAGAGHLLFVTSGMLGLGGDRLEAVLAHELGHHRGLHPILTMLIWWLSLPGVALAAVYSLLRRGVSAVAGRLGSAGRLLGVPLLVLLWVWQLTVMWIYWLGDLLAQRAARVSEYEADDAAAEWGYGPALVAGLEAAGAHDVEPDGRFARLRMDHPPLEERIERLTPRAAAHSSA